MDDLMIIPEYIKDQIAELQKQNGILEELLYDILLEVSDTGCDGPWLPEHTMETLQQVIVNNLK